MTPCLGAHIRDLCAIEDIAAELPFRGASGKGVRVAVIDSGVNLRHPHVCSRTERVVIGATSEGEEADDPVGHGTAVMAAIQEKAPQAYYFGLKIFGRTLRSSGERLIDALDWVLANNIDVVNLSLGTTNAVHADGLLIRLQRLSQRGALVVSARLSGQQLVFPGCLDGAIGVEIDQQISRHRYRVTYVGGVPRFAAAGFPRDLPGVPPARNLQGISFAVANMTGFVIRAREWRGARSVDEIARELTKEAERFSDLAC